MKKYVALISPAQGIDFMPFFHEIEAFDFEGQIIF
jgi:hypothetical protein